MAINYSGPTVSITHPSGNVGAPTVYPLDSLTKQPVIQWTYNDPEENEISQIHVQVFDGSTLVWDSHGVKLPQDQNEVMGDGISHISTLRHFELPGRDVLPFEKTYNVKIRAMDTTEDPRWQKWGEWSAPVFFRVEISPQAALISFDLDVFADHKNKKTILSWRDGVPSGYKITGYNVYSSSEETGTFTKKNTSILTDPFYVDSGVHQFYKIEAVMEDGSTALSPVINGSNISNYWMIGSFKFSGAASFNKKRSRLQSKRSTLKRKQVIQDKGFLPEEINLEIFLTDDQESTGADKYEQLIMELEKLTPLVIRDPFGRSWTVAPGAFDDSPLMSGKEEYRVKIDLSEVSG